MDGEEAQNTSRSSVHDIKMGVGMYAIFAVLETRFTGWSVRGAGGIEGMAGG